MINRRSFIATITSLLSVGVFGKDDTVYVKITEYIPGSPSGGFGLAAVPIEGQPYNYDTCRTMAEQYKRIEKIRAEQLMKSIKNQRVIADL